MHSKWSILRSFFLVPELTRRKANQMPQALIKHMLNLDRVPIDKQEGRRHVLRGAQGAVYQDQQIRGHQVHESTLLQHWSGTFQSRSSAADQSSYQSVSHFKNSISLTFLIACRLTICEKSRPWSAFLPTRTSSRCTKSSSKWNANCFVTVSDWLCGAASLKSVWIKADNFETYFSDEPTGRLALVFELMDMNMYEAIKGRRHYLPEQRVKYYMYQVLKSIDHMHRNGIFHRDIKP